MTAPRWHAELARADRHWATQHRANPLPPDRLAFLIRAFGGVCRDLELELTNRTVLLRRLVDAVNGGVLADVPVEAQVQEALRTLRRIEKYLQSLNHEQEVA